MFTPASLSLITTVYYSNTILQKTISLFQILTAHVSHSLANTNFYDIASISDILLSL